MKKVIIITLSLIALNTMEVRSQEAAVKDTTWKFGGVASINLTQAYYENWTAGGVPSVAGVGFLKTYLNYKKEKWRWSNVLDLGYGLISERERKMRKTDDKFNFDSKLGYNLKGAWYSSFLATFKSQFTPGYEDPEFQLVKVSDFMAPAYVMASFGLDYVIEDKFTFFISPISMKATIVQDQELADKGSFGVEPGKWEYSAGDSTFTNGENLRTEFGAHMKTSYKANIWENVDFLTRLELYANYFDNVGNIDINWEGLLELKINDYLSTNIRVELIYDDDIDILTEVDEEGVEHYGPRLQIKQLFGLGISYKY